MKTNSVEFYHRGKLMPFLCVDAEFQPDKGDLISIEKVTYKVVGRAFTVDHAAEPVMRSMRCNVIVEEAK